MIWINVRLLHTKLISRTILWIRSLRQREEIYSVKIHLMMQVCPDMGYFNFQTVKSGILLAGERIASRKYLDAFQLQSSELLISNSNLIYLIFLNSRKHEGKRSSHLFLQSIHSIFFSWYIYVTVQVVFSILKNCWGGRKWGKIIIIIIKSLCIELVYIYFELLFRSIHFQNDWVLSAQPCSVDTCLNLSKKLSWFCWVCQEICRNKFRIWMFLSKKVSWSKTSNDLVKFVQRDCRLECVNNLCLNVHIS